MRVTAFFGGDAMSGFEARSSGAPNAEAKGTVDACAHEGRNLNCVFWACAAALFLGACATAPPPPPGRYLSDAECRDLTALRTNSNPTLAQHQTEMAALRKAGYDPSPFYDDPYYPDDLQAAQRLLDWWYRTECVPASAQ
jgi:hypothetical protein